MKEEKIDHEHTDQVVCPYCGDATEIEGDPYDASGENTCYACGKIFTCEVNISVTYSTAKDCKLNKEDHNYRLCQQHPDFDHVECTVCEQHFYMKHPETGELLWDKKSGSERVMIEGSRRSWCE